MVVEIIMTMGNRHGKPFLVCYFFADIIYCTRYWYAFSCIFACVKFETAGFRCGEARYPGRDGVRRDGKVKTERSKLQIE